MKKLFLSVILAIAFGTAAFPQTDGRTRTTRIADVVMQLPANSTATFERLMGELIAIDNVIGELAPSLTDDGTDAQLRLAISGLAMYASKDESRKPRVAKPISDAIRTAASDEIRDFLFIQLQYVAGEESVETAAHYLGHPRLTDPAARVLVRTNSAAAGRALQAMITRTSGAQQLMIVQALGDMKFTPANSAISTLPVSGNIQLRKVVFHALAQIAVPASEKILSNAAAQAGYKYEPTNALNAYILFLENSLDRQPAMVRKSAGKMLKATSENTQIAAKTAALELITLSAGDKAISDVVKALKSNNIQYRQAALLFSQNIKSPKMYGELMKVARKEKRADVKAEIITAFGNRGDTDALPFIYESMTDRASNVSAAAIIAASMLAGSDAVSQIIVSMNTNDESIVNAGKNALLSMTGNNMIDNIAAAVPETSTPAKIAFLDILSARRASAHAAVVFEQTTSTEAAVRLAAYRALAAVASENDVQNIAQRLNAATNRDEIAALQRALFAAVADKSQDEKTDIVAEQAATSNNPAVYGNVLAMIGGKKALDLVMEHGFYSSTTALRETAFDVMLVWSDDAAISKLLEIAKGDPTGAFFDRALTAYITKTGASRNTPEQKLLMLRNALEIAQTPAQKQAALRQISRTGTFLGLITAGKYLDDANSDVQQAAVQAVRTIALANNQYYGAEITAILNKAMEVNRDPEAEYQKQAILTHIAGMPEDEGYTSMFNGIDLTGWKGLVENPIARARMTQRELAQRQARADEIMRRDWTVKDGILIFDGPGYDNLCSVKDYGDFEMYMDWKIVPRGDAGVYLRGSPQVQMWDTALRNASVGSGGLFNNQTHPSIPTQVADNPVNEWNSFFIRMVGDKVTIYLNGILVTDNVVLENFWDRNSPIFETGAIELQAHTTRTYYRNLYIRELPRQEPFEVSPQEKAEGFVPMFNGIDFTGWIGALNDYQVRNGAIVSNPVGHGNIYFDKEVTDFIMRFDFKLTPAANNGVSIRSTRDGDRFSLGMELQVLDDEAPVYANLNGYQYHGSVYGVIPARRGSLKPAGEWNTQEIRFEGYNVKVTVNGIVIIDGNLQEASNNFTRTIDGGRHPGLSNKSGYIGLLGHDAVVEFRNMRIKEL